MAIRKKRTENPTTMERTPVLRKRKKNTSDSNVKQKRIKTKHVVNSSSGDLYVSVGRTTLLGITELVSQALPSRELEDAKSGILVEAKYVDGVPMLFMTVNSLNVFIHYGIELQDDIEEGFAVPKGKDFKNIIKGLQEFDSPIEISFDSSRNTFGIKCGDNYDGIIHHYDTNNFIFPPSLDEIKKNETITIPVKFIREAVSKISFACSNDMTIPELTGVLIEQNNNGVNIVGGDGNRIAYLSIRSKVKNPKRVLIGAKYLNMFSSVLKALDVKLNETITLYLSDDKLYFVVDNAVIGIQTYAGEYPIDGGYEQFVVKNKDCEVELKLNKKHFTEKIDLAVLHNNSNMDPITMVISEDGCKLKNVDTSDNKFSIEFDVENIRDDIGDVEIIFTPTYLYDVIKNLNVTDFIFLLQSATGPAVVKPCDELIGEYQYIFSLN